MGRGNDSRHKSIGKEASGTRKLCRFGPEPREKFYNLLIYRAPLFGSGTISQTLSKSTLMLKQAELADEKDGVTAGKFPRRARDIKISVLNRCEKKLYQILLLLGFPLDNNKTKLCYEWSQLHDIPYSYCLEILWTRKSSNCFIF